MHSSLISPKTVNKHLEEPNWRFFDCRYVLTEPDKKQAEFAKSHIPGATYAHVNHDLAAPHIQGKTGRHPLPKIEELSKTFSAWGISSSTQVVVYDDAGGAYAVRLWWMLRWLGHDAVAVLDGGWPRWLKEEWPVSTEVFIPESVKFNANPREHWSVSAADICIYSNNSDLRIFDARSRDRFRGENENIDPIAGHIPGAVSAPFTENLDADRNWKSKSDLRRMYLELLEGSPAEQAITYCGSGITACHNILAMCYAGLGDTRLYSGSWSDWINDPERSVA